MTFTPSSEIKVSVLPEQREWVGYAGDDRAGRTAGGHRRL